MASWASTTFTEYDGDRRGPDEQATLDMGRAVRLLDVPNATFAVRQQAVADFLGYNKVVTVSSKRYISRGTPMPYTWAVTFPAALPSAQYLYAANITRGEGIGPSGFTSVGVTGGPTNQAGGIAVAGSFNRYRYTVEFTTRPYDIKTDTAVQAVNTTTGAGGYPIAGQFPVSPIIGYPDEGQMIAGQAPILFPNWPPTTKPIFSTFSRYITRQFRPASRVRVLSFGMVKWLTDNLPMREGFSAQEATGTLLYEWQLVPEAGIPLYAITQNFNGLNNLWFDSFAPNTLMLKSMDFRRFIGPLGDVLYTLQYNLGWLPKISRGLFSPYNLGSPAGTVPAGYPCGWNYQLRAKGNPAQIDYDEVVSDNSNNNQIFPGVDMTALFRPDQP